MTRLILFLIAFSALAQQQTKDIYDNIRQRGYWDASLSRYTIPYRVVSNAPIGTCFIEGEKVRLILSVSEYTCANGTWQQSNGSSGSGGGGTWGSITGTLSSQTDLQSALNGKENSISAGTSSQYWRGDKTWQDLPAAVRATISSIGGINYNSGTGQISLLPAGASTLGGVRSIDCPSGQSIKTIGTDGIPVCAPSGGSGGGPTYVAGDGIIIVDDEIMIDRAIEPMRYFGSGDPVVAGTENETYINKTPTNPELWVYTGSAWKKAGGSGSSGGGTSFIVAAPAAGISGTSTGYTPVASTPAGTAWTATRASRENLMVTSGTISGCKTNTSSAQPTGGTNGLIITLFKNGVATAVTVTIAPNAAIGTYAFTGSASFAADDKLSWQGVNDVGATSASIASIACQVN